MKEEVGIPSISEPSSNEALTSISFFCRAALADAGLDCGTKNTFVWLSDLVAEADVGVEERWR